MVTRSLLLSYFINLTLLLIKQVTVFISHWIVHLNDLDSFKNKTLPQQLLTIIDIILYNSFNINGSVSPTSLWASITFAVKKRFYSIFLHLICCNQWICIHLFHKIIKKKKNLKWLLNWYLQILGAWVLFTRNSHHQICKTFWQLLRLSLPN